MSRAGDRIRRARTATRARARAEFILETAVDHGVRIAVIGRASDPCVFVWAPTAPTAARQLDCEGSFKRAVRDNLAAVALLGAKPRGRA